jgi:hypothetical protein
MILKLFREQRRPWTSTKLFYLNRCTLSNILAEIVTHALWHHAAAVPPAATSERLWNKRIRSWAYQLLD